MSDDHAKGVLQVLETIAGAFSVESREHQAIKEAAFAFGLVVQHKKLLEVFQRLRTSDAVALPEEQRRALLNMGIDPDA